MRLPGAFRHFLLQIGLWTLLCLSVECFCCCVLHWGSPYDFFDLPRPANFIDFISFIPKFSFFHSLAFFFEGQMLPYPPVAVAAYKVFLTPQPRTPHFAIALFAAAILLVSWVMLAALYRALVRRGLARFEVALFLLALYLLSFPFWFEFVSGNIEFLVWALTAAGIVFAWKERPMPAAICFGVAGAMKLFPFILVGLFLARRQYRAFAVACITAVLSTVAALWLIDPDILESLVGDLGALAHFGNHYVSQIRPLEVGFDHSLYSGIKSVIVPLLPGAYWNLLTVAYMTVAAVGGSLLFFTVIRKLPFLNQVICLSVAAIVLPPVSYDYTLIHLYTPFALLLLFVLDQAHETNDPSRLAPGVAAALALFAFLFSVQSEFIFHGVRYAGQLKTVVLLCLGYVALRYPFTLKRSLDAQLLA